jgi:hypothetical protein
MSLESQKNPICQKVGHVVGLQGMSLENQRNPICQKVGHVVGLTGMIFSPKRQNDSYQKTALRRSSQRNQIEIFFNLLENKVKSGPCCRIDRYKFEKPEKYFQKIYYLEPS